MSTATSLNPTSETFATDVLAREGTVLVEFWAPWCGPCKAFKPVVEALGAEQQEVQVAFVNVDEQPELGQQHGIQSIPALRLFRNGELIAGHVGAMSKAGLEQWLAQHGS